MQARRGEGTFDTAGIIVSEILGDVKGLSGIEKIRDFATIGGVL
ncbi:hypothetical protein HMPREF1986_01899 [Oribacterium sp. oral taxon 078 str. F0263]|nr:hypothetical protein HMPREF1986_01899 [Oribacterium sp. oral taxon 078 str. F0263]